MQFLQLAYAVTDSRDRIAISVVCVWHRRCYRRLSKRFHLYGPCIDRGRLKIESQIPFRQATRRRLSVRVLQVVASLLGVMAVLIGIVVLSPNWNLLRGPIAGYLSSKLDRKVAIDGDLKVRLSLQPEIEVNKLTVGNASWGTHPSMVEMERVKFRVELAPLLQRRIVVPEVELLRAVVALERNVDGMPNWEFHEGSPDGSWAPEIGSLTIHDGKIVYEDVPAASEGCDRHRIGCRSAARVGPHDSVCG